MSTFSDSCFASLQERGILDADHNLTPATITKNKMLSGVAYEAIPLDDITLDLLPESTTPISPALRRLQADNALAGSYISFRLLAYQCPHLFIDL